ncbi:hypothetical protein PHMEG_00033613 [Phytophthora megakarya]|uniref:Uncharacterized protein n=1 Tax=Phytophthora megakarya TaxID=4795 RepID=A0A225UST3_9STRA|nr:hypothetical protein PHMEG_00033613 [Phytophthora megakarya]
MEDTATGWLHESQVNRKLEGRDTTGTEERANWKSLFRKKQTAPKTLQQSPSVAKVVKESPAIGNVIKNNREIGRTVSNMQKDKELMKEVQSSPVLKKATMSFRHNPSRKFTEAEIKKLGTATAKSMKSPDKWNPAWVIALGVLIAIVLVAGSLGIDAAVNGLQ